MQTCYRIWQQSRGKALGSIHSPFAAHLHNRFNVRAVKPPRNVRQSSTASLDTGLALERHSDIIENATGYRFKDLTYVKLIAWLKDVPHPDVPGVCSGRDHLAFIGDGMWRVVYGIQNFPTQKPETMRGRYNIIASNAYLASIGQRCGLRSLAAGVKLGITKNSIHEQGTTVEALWGAIFLDSGYDYASVKSAMEKMLAKANLLQDDMLGGPAVATPLDTVLREAIVALSSNSGRKLDDPVTAIALDGSGFDDLRTDSGSAKHIKAAKASVTPKAKVPPVKRRDGRHKKRDLKAIIKQELDQLLRAHRGAARRLEKKEAHVRRLKTNSATSKENPTIVAGPTESAANT